MTHTDSLTNDTILTRIEKDLLGEQAVPATALYGIQTQRAYQNFNITGVPISHFPDLIKALAMVKHAAAKANYQHGLLSDDKSMPSPMLVRILLTASIMKRLLLTLFRAGLARQPT
jgi:aspartate ammonia-lyase